METTIVSWGVRESGKENGNYYSNNGKMEMETTLVHLGLYGDHGK